MIAITLEGIEPAVILEYGSMALSDEVTMDSERLQCSLDDAIALQEHFGKLLPSVIKQRTQDAVLMANVLYKLGNAINRHPTKGNR